MATAYTAPLRSAIIALSRHGLPFSLSALTGVGLCTPIGASSFAGRLVARRVLIRVGEDYAVGPSFDEWAREAPRTRPGGHRLRFVNTRKPGQPRARA